MFFAFIPYGMSMDDAGASVSVPFIAGVLLHGLPRRDARPPTVIL